MTEAVRSLQPGDRAPDFTLTAANREGTVSLKDFFARRAVLLGLFRGLHCPFCRRQVFQLGILQPTLAALGVETIAVMNTSADRARLYFRYHPTATTLLADPDAATHRAFAVPSFALDEPLIAALNAARVNPTGELPEAMPPLAANDALNRLDGFEMTAADEAIFAAHPAQLTGYFLIDREGIVRWATVEATAGLNDLSKFPTPAELLAAARSLGTPA
jgi:peroxiredoxin